MRALLALVSVPVMMAAGNSLGAAGLPSAGSLAGTYFCSEEIAGGLRYDELSKRWIGSAFSNSGQFIVKLLFIGQKVITEINGNRLGGEYNIDILSTKGGNPLYCLPRPNFIYDTLPFLECSSISEYRINFRTNRFIRIYREGYTTGEDTNENNPAIIGGTCTKIE
jgi:hypothetical protein